MAKTETTVRSYYYTVTSPNGGTVTDGSGKLNKTVEAGDQVTVQAPSDSLTCSDDDAVIYKANFNGALAALGLLGGGSDKLPAGYTRLAFLQGTGTQYINTGATGNETSEVLCTFERTSAASPAIYAAAKQGVSNNFICAFAWGNVMETLRFDWFTSQQTVKNVYPGGMVTTVQSAKCVTLNGVQLPLTFPEGAFVSPVFVLFSLRAEQNAWTADNIRMSSWALKNGGQPVRDMVAALDPTGTPCMYDRVTGTAYRRGGTGQFIAGVGTVAQLSTLLRKLPSTGGELTLSLPAEANTPEVAEQLQACYDTKGWTLTVHEYRPAAAATYSLRRVREVVWCRREQSELGGYVDPTGTRWQIDRCAAIFGALGQDPAEYCYSPFDSVEQAVEFWELEPYEYPEEIAD